VPANIEVEIVDFDNLEAMGGNLEAFITDGHASQEAVDFLQEKGLI